MQRTFAAASSVIVTVLHGHKSEAADSGFTSWKERRNFAKEKPAEMCTPVVKLYTTSTKKMIENVATTAFSISLVDNGGICWVAASRKLARLGCAVGVRFV